MPTTNDLSLYIFTAPQQPESTSKYTGNFLCNGFDSIKIFNNDIPIINDLCFYIMIAPMQPKKRVNVFTL